MTLMRTHAQRQDQAEFVNWTVQVGRLSERFLSMSYEQLEEDHRANFFYGEGMTPIQFFVEVVLADIENDHGSEAVYEILFDALYFPT